MRFKIYFIQNCTLKWTVSGGIKMKKSQKTAIYGLFAALIVVLQLLSYVVKIGTFNLSLVLIPIVLGAYLYGPKAGAIFGGVFGAVVVICCITGLDAGGYILFSASPILTSLVCLIKGAAAGFVAGAIPKLLPKANNLLTIMLSAIAAPVVNTGLFIVSLLLFFKDILASWAGGTDLVTYIQVGLIGVNFLIELLINVIMAPSLLTVKNALKK